jgi:site-specific DNA recombinase
VLAEYDDTPEGRLQKHIRATVAEYEREKIKERSVRGRRNVVKLGKVMTAGNSPYGYQLSEDGKSLVVYEPEAKIVGLIFGWYVDEQIGYAKIAKRLTYMGVPTWVDARPKYTYKKRGPAEWASSSIGSILKNQTYIGKWHYCKQGGGPLIQVSVPAIITDLQWKQAQYIREDHSRTNTRNTKREYLMQQRLTCICTYAIQARQFGRKEKQYPYYYCPSHNGNTGVVHTKCGLPYYRADYVDRVVWDWLVDWFRDPDDLRRKLEAYQAEREQANAPIMAALKVNDDLIAENQRQLDRLLDAYQSGVFDLDAVTERKHRLDETIAALGREREKLQGRLAGELTSDEIKSLFQFSSELSRGLDKMSKNFAARRKVIEMLDVRGILVVEGNERVCNASFILGEKRLVVNSGQGDSTPWMGNKKQKPTSSTNC